MGTDYASSVVAHPHGDTARAPLREAGNPGDTALPRGHTACTQSPPDRKHCTNTAHNGCTNSCHRPPPTGGPDGDDLFGCATIPGGHTATRGTQPHSGHTATLRAHSHTQGTQPHSGDTHCRPPTPPTRPEQQKPHITVRTLRTNGKQDQPPQDTASPGTQPCQQTPLPPQGHSAAQGTHRLHTKPPGQKALYKYCTQWLHQQLSQTAADGWPRRR